MANRLFLLILAAAATVLAQSGAAPDTPLTYFLGRGGRTPTPGGGPGSSPTPVYPQAVAAGPGGDIWIVSEAPGNTLPIVNAFQDEPPPADCGPFGECSATVLSRLRADGQGAVFSTYLSRSGADMVFDLAVDEQGNSYLVGNTSSESFPFDRDLPDDAPTEYRPFAIKISPSGEIVYAIPLPSGVSPAAIAADGHGSAYIGGASSGEVEQIGGLGLEPDGAHLLRSDDGGASWQFRNRGITNAGLLSDGTGFVAAGHDDDVRLYALGESLYRSDDRGQVWQSFAPPMAEGYRYFTDMAVDAAQPERVFVAYGCALHASQDAGETWNRLLAYESPGRCVSQVALAPGQPQIVYAGGPTIGNGGSGTAWMGRSNDGGQSWSDVPMPEGGTQSLVFDLAVDPTDAEVVYADFFAETGEPGVTPDSLQLYRTDNAGQSWRRIFTGSRITPAIDPAAPQTLFLVAQFPEGGNRVYRSFDRGETWVSSELPEPAVIHGELMSVALGPEAVYVTTGQGRLYVSADRGETWAGTPALPVPAFRVAADPVLPDTVYTVGSGLQGQGFLMKLNPDASRTDYLTLLGGSGFDLVQDIAVDDEGRVYATGITISTDFPGATPLTSKRPGFDRDAFLAIVSPGGDQIEYSTWVGGSGSDTPTQVALGKDNTVVLAGFTDSMDFPLENPIAQNPGRTQSNWIAAVKPDDSRIVFAGYLGQYDRLGPLALAADTEGSTYVSGSGAFLNENGTTTDRDFLMRLDAAGNVTNTDVIAVDILAADAPGRVVTAVAGASGIWNYDPRVYDIPAAAVSVIDYNNPGDAGKPRLRAMINAADQRGHPLTPATVVSIYGSNLGPATPMAAEPVDGRFPAELAGVRVLFGARPASLLYVSEGQINAVTPGDLGDHPLVSVRVERDGMASNLVVLTTSSASPAIFSMDSGNEPVALAINADGTLNSPDNPAAPGSTVSIFATGVGSFSPALADGEVTPLEPPFPTAADIASVGFLSARAQITYAGAAPGVVGGVAQVNFVVPVELPGGNYYLDIEAGEGKKSGPVHFSVGP